MQSCCETSSVIPILKVGEHSNDVGSSMRNQSVKPGGGALPLRISFVICPIIGLTIAKFLILSSSYCAAQISISTPDV